MEDTAYLPLLSELAVKGIDCFLIKMPCNLAFLGRIRQEKSWMLMSIRTGICLDIL